MAAKTRSRALTPAAFLRVAYSAPAPEEATATDLRRFTLPESANTESIKAKQTNGVLEVSIPKHPQVQPRRISVEAA